jgi:glycosyltransferase involved in cell wall biosynthesis
MSAPVTASPLISVVVPVYNGMPFVLATIESVRAQTCADWELVICDNASTDNTAERIEQYLKEKPDPRIRLIRHTELLAMGANWNRSLPYAAGQFIKLLPADDILLPDCLETQQRILKENPGVGFVTSGKEVIDASGRVLLQRVPVKEGIYDWSRLGRRILFAVANIIGEPGGVLFRRELLESCGPFNPRYNYYIDIELLLRFLKKSNVYVCGRPLYQFRIHGGSGTATSRERAHKEYRALLEEFAGDLDLARKPWLRRYLDLKSRLVVFARGLVLRRYLKSTTS